MQKIKLNHPFPFNKRGIENAENKEVLIGEKFY